MRRFTYLIGLLIAIVGLVIFLFVFEIQSVNNIYLKTFWHNIKFISTALYIAIPLILLLGILLLLFTNRWALRVEKLSVGGFNIIFDNPAYLYKKQVRNFLDTKRSIFKIDCEYDNFSETLDSYFEIYKFFRNEVKILGDTRKKRLGNNDAIALYNLTNRTIRILNNFLTENQNNYRRWYTYVEKYDEKKYYLTPIGELQKEYPHYEKLCCEFKKVNEFFVHQIANQFDIDIQKWSIAIVTD